MQIYKKTRTMFHASSPGLQDTTLIIRTRF